MISVIVNYIKEKSKLLYTIAVIGVIFYFINSQWSEFKRNWYSLTPIIKIILIHMPSVLLIFTFVCASISLFKISNRKSNEKMTDYLKSQKIEVEYKFVEWDESELEIIMLDRKGDERYN
ncbi:hypothetical protein [Bacillus thuringiensis]|uniref:hypothetical protein n=1 Tax=Bacillus thuringiensis TaxID=1428 RepID=UPI00211D4CF5|nr:hypothetical protein [Bacillus thuringiensis]